MKEAQIEPESGTPGGAAGSGLKASPAASNPAGMVNWFMRWGRFASAARGTEHSAPSKTGRGRAALVLGAAAMESIAFPALTVCGLDELDGHAGRGVTHVLSILDPDWPEPEAFLTFGPHFRATLRFHDAIEPAPGVVLAERADVETILAFGREAGDVSHLLIHCHAGVSRSTAAMLMILGQAYPRESENVVVDRLLAIRPQAWPNSRMIAFADELLGGDGRLNAALARIYANRLKAQPEFAKLMRQSNRGREVELGLRHKG
jgi:predicted protein tyrosine phosphatase